MKAESGKLEARVSPIDYSTLGLTDNSLVSRETIQSDVTTLGGLIADIRG